MIFLARKFELFPIAVLQNRYFRHRKEILSVFEASTSEPRKNLIGNVSNLKN